MRRLAVRALTSSQSAAKGCAKLLITAREGPVRATSRRRSAAAGAAARPGRVAGPIRSEGFLATWRSGYAAACKAVYTGSIPVVASRTVKAVCTAPRTLVRDASAVH